MIVDASTQEILRAQGIPLGSVTNNQAEFLALKHALTGLTRQGLSGDQIEVLTDSQLVVGIFSQNWRAKATWSWWLRSGILLKEFPQLTFAYVRGHNGNQRGSVAAIPVNPTGVITQVIRRRDR